MVSRHWPASHGRHRADRLSSIVSAWDECLKVSSSTLWSTSCASACHLRLASYRLDTPYSSVATWRRHGAALCQQRPHHANNAQMLLVLRGE